MSLGSKFAHALRTVLHMQEFKTLHLWWMGYTRTPSSVDWFLQYRGASTVSHETTKNGSVPP